MLLASFVICHLLSVFLVQTTFVPDEYWQSLEVAHNVVFGYGYLTWEWKKGIRSYLYPMVFAALYKFLQVVGGDTVYMLTTVPCVLQALLSAASDYYTCMFMANNFGKDSAKWTGFCLLTSWFWFYSGSRTLTNTTEAALTGIALYFYPWKGQEAEKSPIKYFTIVCLACIIRPTAIIVWFPLCLYHLWRVCWRAPVCLVYYTCIGLACLGFSTAVDCLCYGDWIFPAWNFLQFNVIEGLGSFYGVHSWHWYITQGIPVVLGPHIIIFVLAVLQTRGQQRILLGVVVWTVVILSLLPHKEFRFLLPLLPFACGLCGSYLQRLAIGPDKDHPKEFLGLLKITMALCLLVNIVMALYFAMVHQRGPLDCMRFLAEEVQQKPNSSLLFLLPCHTTPLYSHLHTNIPARFLTCEPDFTHQPDYIDEADIFYNNPQKWLEQNFALFPPPSHVILFNLLRANTTHFWESRGYQLCHDVFNAHFTAERVGDQMMVLCH